MIRDAINIFILVTVMGGAVAVWAWAVYLVNELRYRHRERKWRDKNGYGP